MNRRWDRFWRTRAIKGRRLRNGPTIIIRLLMYYMLAISCVYMFVVSLSHRRSLILRRIVIGERYKTALSNAVSPNQRLNQCRFNEPTQTKMKRTLQTMGALKKKTTACFYDVS